MDFITAFRLCVLGLCLFLAWEAVQRRRAAALPSQTGAGPQEAVFLFRDDVLIDVNPAAQHLLIATGREGRSLAAVTGLLALRFSELPETLSRHDPPAEERLAGAEEILTIHRWQNFLRLTLSERAEDTTPAPPQVQPPQAVLAAELATLRAIAEDAPQLIWKEDLGGRVNWANRAYLAEAAHHLPPPPDGGDGADLPPVALWPDQPIFADLPGPAEEGASLARRAALALPAKGGAPATTRWFEVTRIRRGGQIISFAQDTSGAVAAEDSRRNLLQTLTKTFAHLSSGLAIFDRHRRLILFNPAFLDMTGLRVDFLSQRPLVHSVLDKLHDMQMLPEPRHYASWREQLAALEAAAEEGSYCETWMMPNGATYRVSGRPHGDGALAFVFEDISDETALSRQFRAEQEAAQAIFDRLSYGVAAFSRGGVMILHNAAYDRLWPRAEAGGGHGLVAAHLGQEMARWRRGTITGTAWDRLADHLAQPFAGATSETVQTLTGQTMRVVVSALPGGARQVEFLPEPASETAPRLRGGTGAKARRLAGLQGT